MIALYPGAFKLLTDGHDSLIQKCIKSSLISKVLVIVSSKDRDGISGKLAFDFISYIYKDEKKVEVALSPNSSPISFCYDLIRKLKKGSFCLVSSSKDEDDSRTKDFVKSFAEGGKFWAEGVRVSAMPFSDSPAVYKNRAGKFNGKPISATVMREDIARNDFKSFMTNVSDIAREYDIPTEWFREKFSEARKEMIRKDVSESLASKAVLNYNEIVMK